MPIEPHAFWQEIHPPKTFEVSPPDGFTTFFPATLHDGRQIQLPIRELPNGKEALASIIINQASFSVLDALAERLTALISTHRPEIVVGIPTLGLTLADNVARRLGHNRMVPLGTSRKFWYDDGLSVPMGSITSPGTNKRLYLDPRMLPLLTGKSVILIDDVLSSGASMEAALSLLEKAKIRPATIGVAMFQGEVWRQKLSRFSGAIEGVFSTPVLQRSQSGGWIADAD